MPKTKSVTKKTAKRTSSKSAHVPAHKHPHYRRRLLLWVLLLVCAYFLFAVIWSSIYA